jgi:hypothetical protein
MLYVLYVFNFTFTSVFVMMFCDITQPIFYSFVNQYIVSIFMYISVSFA